jgi:hypothetical protein
VLGPLILDRRATASCQHIDGKAELARRAGRQGLAHELAEDGDEQHQQERVEGELRILPPHRRGAHSPGDGELPHRDRQPLRFADDEPHRKQQDGKDERRRRLHEHSGEQHPCPPQQHRIRRVAGDMIGLGNQHDAGAEHRAADQQHGMPEMIATGAEQPIGDGVGQPQRAEQHAEPDKARQRLPVGGDEGEDGQAQQHRAEDRQHCPRREAAIGRCIARHALLLLGADPAPFAPAGEVAPQSSCIAEHVLTPNR